MSTTRNIQSSFGLFDHSNLSEEKLSQDEQGLITLLNTILIKMNHEINKLDKGITRDTLKYLMAAGSKYDPYQLNLIQLNVAEAISNAKTKLDHLHSGTYLLLCAASFLTSYLSSNNPDFISRENEKMITVSSYMAGTAALIAGINDKIDKECTKLQMATLHNIKELAQQAEKFNGQLSILLKDKETTDLSFRQSFFDRHISPGDTTVQKQPSSASYAEWDLQKGGIMPRKIGYISK